MSEKQIIIDAERVTMGDIRRLSKAFTLDGMYDLLRRASNLTTDEEIDALSVPEMRQVLDELSTAISSAFVPKAN